MAVDADGCLAVNVFDECVCDSVACGFLFPVKASVQVFFVILNESSFLFESCWVEYW